MRKILNTTSKYYLYIIILLIVFISFFTFICLIKTDSVLAKIKENKEEITKNEEVKYIKVDIKGNVINPGVYNLPEESRVIDAVNLAGGFKESSDTSLINLAKKLKDEMVIVIYSVDEIKSYNETKIKTEYVYVEIDSCPDKINNACANEYKTTVNEQTKTSENLSNENSLISINNATLEQLMTLPSIGESKANSIIEYRKQNGDFKNILDLKNVSGIGDSIFEKIKEKITV